MRITRLKPGERADDEEDRVHIDRLGGDQVAWMGSVAVNDAAVFGTSRREHRTIEEAEAEAIAWAESHGAEEIKIEVHDA